MLKRGFVTQSLQTKQGAIRRNKQVIWHCLHEHSSQDGALACASAALGLLYDITRHPYPNWRLASGRIMPLRGAP